MEKRAKRTAGRKPAASVKTARTRAKVLRARRKKKITSHRKSFLKMIALWASGLGLGAFALGFYWQTHRSAPAPVAASQPVVQAQTTQAPVRVPASQPARTPNPWDAQFDAAAKMPLGDRVAFWSNYLWKNADAQTCFGEFGAMPSIADSAPLVPQSFDCTTFVETVAALSRSRVPEDFFKNVIAMRYRGSQTTFENRNHFPEADWIPNNQAAGILKDITWTVARDAGLTAQTVSKRIERARWLAQQERNGTVTRAIASVAETSWQPSVDAQVNYIPIAEVSRVMGRIPNGAIVNFVRNNHSGHPVLITHQGLIVREKGGVFFRHSSAGGHVRTVLLKDYLARQMAEVKKNQAPGWRLIGINLNQLSG